MKQQSTKKSKLWLWLVLALAVLVAAGGILLAVLSQQQAGPQGDSVNAELYWNLDREKFIEEDTGLSTREKEADGLYHMRFAYEGQQVVLPIADKQLVNVIDAMDAVGLVLDADGLIIDAVAPKTFVTEVCNQGFVRKVEGNTLYANSARTMAGMDFTIPLTENTGIYDVSADAENPGAPATCSLMDTITVFADSEGNATHVYIVKHPVDADVYWRVGRYYDSENSCTTRVPDENGVYTMLFAKDGEQVELKCRDKYFVDHIDSLSPLVCQQALVFDEEGYIIDNTDIAMAIRGKYLCQYYAVTGIDGDQVTAERIQSGAEQGMVKTFTLGKDCDIFMCCSGCHASHIGERTDHLRVGDTVNVYTDLDGNAILIFVSTRPVESKLYYNLEQKYNSTTKETRREPENGWYVYKMFCDGKTVTVKTKDKTIANAVDSTLVMGLELDGNVVLRTYPTRCVTGTNSTATNKYVTSISGTIFTAASATDLNNPVNAIMAPDCKIYDMTGDYGVEKGSLTTLKMYDRVFTYSDMYGLVSHIFVYSRYAPGTSVYYNVSRKYDSKNQVTTREPDADGYYVYDMITNGKEVTVKTKSKSMASFIDAQSAPTVALRVSGGIIREAHLAHMAVKFGSKQDNYVYIDKVNSNSYTTYYYSGEQKVYGTVTRKIASNCAIYNVSQAYRDHQGEKTTLQPGDRIQSIVSAATGEAVMVFVLSREVDSPLYWHVKRSYNATTGETRRKPDAEGWYVFDLAADGQVKQFKTQDKAIASAVDQFSGGFVLITDGDVILRACNATLHKQVKANAAGAYDVMAMNGNKITLTRNRPLATNYGDTKELTLAEGCKIYNVSSYAEPFGAEVKLQLGDRVTCYSNDDGEVSFIFITNQNTRKAGHISYCDHCNKEVFWNPFTGELYETDAHYYLTNDTTASTCKNIGSTEKDYAICLDLNGKTFNSKSRAFLVYSTLSIMDSAGGGSVIGSGYKDITLGGCVLIANGGTLNLHGGTLTLNENAHIPGKGGVVNVGNGAAFNMYGGAVKGGRATNQGGNIYVNGSVFNLYGGTIAGGTADLAGGNLYTAAKSTVLLAGGTIAGDAVIGTGSNVTVAGELIVSKGQTAGLKLTAGDKLKLGQLKGKASIVVSAEGVFTQVKDNISQYLSYFKPFKDKDTIQIQEGALACIKTLVDLNKVNNSNLSFQEGTTKAMCPVCEIEVTWIALGTARTNTTDGSHYYLAEDIIYDGETNWHVTAPENGTACLHLNGHTLNSPTRAIQGNTGVLNVMGNGTVYGNYSDTSNPHRGATVDTTPSKAACADINAINLIGGTYMSAPNTTQTNTVSIWDNGGRVRIYAGATVSGSIYVGKSSILSSELAIHGGTVSGTVTMAGSDKNTALLTLAGGTTERILLPSNAQCIVSGAPTVNKLEIAPGAKLTLGDVTANGTIVVSADGVFTQVKDNISQYLTAFTPFFASDTIEVAEGALTYVKVPMDLNKLDNSDLVFQEDTTIAMCPVCQSQVTWTALTEKRTNTVSGGHYYLAADVTYEGGTNWYLTAPDSGSACLHLNGHKLTSPTRAIQGNTGALNVMGNGTVTGNFTDPNNLHRGATVDTTPSKANCAEVTAINLLGGTYINAANSTQTNVISIWDNGGRVRIYAGATVSGGIYVGKSSILGSELAIHGGTVNGTVTMAGSDKNTALLNLAGGTVRRVQLPANAQCTVSGAPVVTKLELVSGAKLTLGALTDGASLTVAADGVFTNPCDQANSYLGYFHTSSDGDTITPVDNTLVYTKSLIDNNPYDGELNLDANGYAQCPACNENVQWTDLNSLSDARFGFKNDKTSYDAGTTPSYHFYLSDDLNYTKNAQYAERYYNINCLHLNGHKLSYTTRMSIGIGATLNIMGSGSITGSCNSTNDTYNTSVLYTYNGGTINLYEGTYNCTNAAVPTALIGNKGTLTIMGGTSVGLINADTTGKLVVGADWSGTAKVGFTSQITDNLIPEANGVSLGAFTGQLTLNTSGRPLLVDQNGRLAVVGDLFEQELVLDANGYAQCPACNENVQWTDLNSLSDARFGFKNDKTSYDAGTTPSYHFYLSNDLAYTKNAQYAERYYNINCLHLNGHNLSYNSRMSIGVGATLNIMGTGSITSSCNSTTAANNTSTLYTYNGGTINLYGGTINCTNTEVPSVLIGSNAATQVNLYDGATVKGGLTANNGTVTISGDSSVDALSIATPAKLVVSADWSGTATASFARQIVDGFVPEASGVSQGAFTGILNLTDGTPVTGKNGKLAVRSFDPSQDDGVLKILGIGNSYTMDSMHLLYDVYKAENPDKEVVLSFLYYGACSLQSHASFLTNNSDVYTYYKLDGQIYAETGKWQQTKEVTMRMALLDEQWDIVTLQQYSAYSAKPATYDSSIGTIRDYVELTLGYKPEFAWNFTWGYPDDAELLKLSSDTYAQEFFDTYGTTEEMYNRISAAVQEKIVNGSYSFDYLMSVGTAVQNARSNYLTAKDLYRDHTHLNNLGRIIAAYTWFCELEGYDGDTKPLTELKLKQVPASLALTTAVSNGVAELDAEMEQIVLESINNALKNKFQVTKTQ